MATESVSGIWSVAQEAGAPAWLSPTTVEFVTNVILFVPLSFIPYQTLLGRTHGIEEISAEENLKQLRRDIEAVAAS